MYLKTHTSYFSNESNDDDDNNLEIVASTLFKHMLQLICNGHAITDVITDDSNDSNAVDLVEKRIGTAIYPSASMMNHSCEPSIITRCEILSPNSNPFLPFLNLYFYFILAFPTII